MDSAQGISEIHMVTACADQFLRGSWSKFALTRANGKCKPMDKSCRVYGNSHIGNHDMIAGRWAYIAIFL